MRTRNEIIIDGDMDYSVSLTKLSVNVNERNTERLTNFCKYNSRRIHVYSDYDCTGQLCAIRYELIVILDEYYIVIRRNYDY